jgi:hypothetical protein
LLEAVEVWICFVGLDGAGMSRRWECHWFTRHEAWKPFWWKPRRTTDSESVDSVLGFGLAGGVEILLCWHGAYLCFGVKFAKLVIGTAC